MKSLFLFLLATSSCLALTPGEDAFIKLVERDQPGVA